MTHAERRFVAGAVRRKKLFLILCVVGVVGGGLLAAYYGYRRYHDPTYPLGVHAALVVLIFLNARQNLRQHRYAAVLEKMNPREPDVAAGLP